VQGKKTGQSYLVEALTDTYQGSGTGAFFMWTNSPQDQ